MPVLTVNVDNPDEMIALYGTAPLIRAEYSADGSTGWTEFTTETIVSGTTQYLLEHQTASTYYYRTRYSKASPSTSAHYSDYSDSWLVGALDAYATVDEVREVLQLGTNTAHDNVLLDLLSDVSDDLDAICQRRFYRDPQVSGTATVYADVRYGGCSSLEDAIGRPRFIDGRALDIVSVTTLYVRDSETSAYVEVSAGDTGYYLDTWGVGIGVAGTDWPYEDITLSPAANYSAWPIGRRAVKIVGAFGFPKVPGPVRRAVVSEVAERFRQKIGGGQAAIGVNQFGTPIFLTGDSPDYRRVTRAPWSRRRMAA